RRARRCTSSEGTAAPRGLRRRRRSSRARGRGSSYAADLPPPEQAGRLDEQDREQDGEGERHVERDDLRQVAAEELVEDDDRETADDGTPWAVQAAEHRGREG